MNRKTLATLTLVTQITITGFILTWVPSVSAQVACTQPNPNDSSGNAFTLTEEGAPGSRVSPEAKYGIGYDYDGSNDELNRAGTDVQTSGDLTIFVRLEFDALPGAGSSNYVVQQGNTLSDNAIHSAYELRVFQSGAIQYFHGNGASQFSAASADGVIVAGGAQSVVIIRDDTADSVVVRVDGTNVISASYVGGVQPTANTGTRLFTLGFPAANTPAQGVRFNGGYYEARIWFSVVSDAIINDIADPDVGSADTAEGTERALWYLGECNPQECTVEFVEEGFGAQSEPAGTPSGPWIRLVAPVFFAAGDLVQFFARTYLDGNVTNPERVPVLEVTRVNRTTHDWSLVFVANMTNTVDYTTTINEANYTHNWTVPFTIEDGELLHVEVCSVVSDTIVRAQESRETNSQTGARGPAGPTGPTGLTGPPTTVNHTYLTTPGTGQYTVPANVTRIMVECVGPGGGSAGADAGVTNPGVSAGAGAGGYARKTFHDVAGNVYNWTVGAAGTGGTAGNNPGTQGDSTLWVDATDNSTILDCGGGQPSTNGATCITQTNRLGANGGTATGGDINIPGTTGERSTCAGGEEVAVMSFSGRGAPSYYGDGGAGRTTTGSGNPGTGAGAGAGGALAFGGAADQAGGDGADGLIIIWEFGETITIQGPPGVDGEQGEPGEFNNTVFGLLSAFPGFAVDESSALVLLILTLALAYHQRLLFLAIASVMGFLDLMLQVTGDNQVLGFVGTLFLLILAFFIEALRDIRNEALEAHKHKEQDGV